MCPEGVAVSSEAREPASFDTIADIDVGAARAAILQAALELDMFTVIGPRTVTCEEAARETATDARALAVLLDALCGLGLLDKSPSGYRLSETATAFLSRDSESFRGDVFVRMSAARHRLADVVRSGCAVDDLSAPSGGEFWAQFTSQRLVTWPEEVEEELETWRDLGVTPESQPGIRVLDVACGAGIRTFGLAREDAQAHIVAVDSAPVLEIARKVAEKMRLSDRVTFRPADIATADLGSEEFDIVLLSYLLYFFTTDRAVGLLDRVRKALKPRGRVVIRALIPDEDRCSATDTLVDAVELLLWLPESRVYAYSEYEGLLARAGFVEVSRHGEQVITAVRPA